jgi:hypothetical protein
VTGWLGWRKGTEAQGATRAGERVMARRWGGGDRQRSRRWPSHGREEGADKRDPLAGGEREIARERGECGLTGGAELAAAEGRGVRARGRWAAKRGGCGRA